MSNKLTPWFPVHIKPVRDGVYQVRFSPRQTAGYAYWVNGRWGISCIAPEEAVRNRNYVGNPNKQWRGLAYDTVTTGGLSERMGEGF